MTLIYSRELIGSESLLAKWPSVNRKHILCSNVSTEKYAGATGKMLSIREFTMGKNKIVSLSESFVPPKMSIFRFKSRYVIDLYVAVVPFISSSIGLDKCVQQSH